MKKVFILPQNISAHIGALLFEKENYEHLFKLTKDKYYQKQACLKQYELNLAQKFYVEQYYPSFNGYFTFLTQPSILICEEKNV